MKLATLSLPLLLGCNLATDHAVFKESDLSDTIAQQCMEIIAKCDEWGNMPKAIYGPDVNCDMLESVASRVQCLAEQMDHPDPQFSTCANQSIQCLHLYDLSARCGK